MVLLTERALVKCHFQHMNSSRSITAQLGIDGGRGTTNKAMNSMGRQPVR